MFNEATLDKNQKLKKRKKWKKINEKVVLICLH